MIDSQIDLAARFLQGVGLAELPLDVAAQRMESYCRGTQGQWSHAGSTSDAAEALMFLSTLTIPATRHVLFAGSNNVTGMINNCRNGSDYADEVYRLPRSLHCRLARVVNCPHIVWRKGKLREVQQYGARIFDLHDAQGEAIRIISCMNDGGRWVYHSAGTPHAVESTFGPLAARLSRRFPPEQLAAVAAAFGFPLPTPESFHSAPRYVMFVQVGTHVNEACTLAEADDPAYRYFLRGMGYAKFVNTHAASVVADLERCLAINPGYESRVREQLHQARQRLSR